MDGRSNALSSPATQNKNFVFRTFVGRNILERLGFSAYQSASSVTSGTIAGYRGNCVVDCPENTYRSFGYNDKLVLGVNEEGTPDAYSPFSVNPPGFIIGSVSSTTELNIKVTFSNEEYSLLFYDVPDGDYLITLRGNADTRESSSGVYRNQWSYYTGSNENKGCVKVTVKDNKVISSSTNSLYCNITRPNTQPMVYAIDSFEYLSGENCAEYYGWSSNGFTVSDTVVRNESQSSQYFSYYDHTITISGVPISNAPSEIDTVWFGGKYQYPVHLSLENTSYTFTETIFNDSSNFSSKYYLGTTQNKLLNYVHGRK